MHDSTASRTLRSPRFELETSPGPFRISDGRSLSQSLRIAGSVSFSLVSFTSDFECPTRARALPGPSEPQAQERKSGASVPPPMDTPQAPRSACGAADSSTASSKALRKTTASGSESSLFECRTVSLRLCAWSPPYLCSMDPEESRRDTAPHCKLGHARRLASIFLGEPKPKRPASRRSAAKRRGSAPMCLICEKTELTILVLNTRAAVFPELQHL